jgi:hypothetical protein
VKDEKCLQNLGLKPSGRRNERPRRTWADDKIIYIEEIICEGVDWIHLAQNRIQWQDNVNAVMNLRVQ